MLDQWENQIICGDCLELMAKLPERSIDFVLTDIPYNISQESNGLRNLDYGEHDKQTGMEVAWITLMEWVVRNSIITFCCGAQLSGLVKFLDNKKFITRPLFWIKPNPTVMNCDKLYINTVELAVYGKRPRSFYRPHYKRNTFFYSPPSNKNRLHPNQKPKELFCELIIDNTEPGDLVLDPFIGSGTTAVACVETGRRFIGMELSEAYCEIARKRVEAAMKQGRLF